MADEKASFLHLSGDKSFNQRADAIFGKLNSLEPEINTTEVADKEENEPKQERVFNKPSRNYNRRMPKRVPDHILNPTKWKKYSLEEDGTRGSGLSGDALNKHVALSFLEDLKKRKSTETEHDKDVNPDSESACSSKHVFAKPVSAESEDSQGISAAVSVGIGRQLIMPEYQVGNAPKKTARKRKLQESSSSEAQSSLSLQHLEDEEKNEEDSSGDSQKTEEKVQVKFAKRHGEKKKSFRKRSEDKETQE